MESNQQLAKVPKSKLQVYLMSGRTGKPGTSPFSFGCSHVGIGALACPASVARLSKPPTRASIDCDFECSLKSTLSPTSNSGGYCLLMPDAKSSAALGADLLSVQRKHLRELSLLYLGGRCRWGNC